MHGPWDFSSGFNFLSRHHGLVDHEGLISSQFRPGGAVTVLERSLAVSRPRHCRQSDLLANIIAMAQDVEKIAVMAGSLLAGLPDACAAPFRADFPKSFALRRETPPTALPVLQYFKPGGPPLAAALHEIRHSLAWSQTYSPSDFGPEFLEKYGWTEIIGPRGPIPSAKIACGFLLLGPGVTYPDHHHTAEELYIVISGTAAWRRGGENWCDKRPGAVIHHPSNMPHAMRTRDEMLLALYFWRAGDLQQKSNF